MTKTVNRSALSLSAIAIMAGAWAAAPLLAQETVQQVAPSFNSTFGDLGPVAARLEPAGNAVDLDSFKPKRELPPKPKPKPKTNPKSASYGGVVRSLGTGVASFYGKRFHGRLTANGERFNMNAMTAAHKTLPFGTKVRVTYPRNGRSIVVRINDRGPFIKGRHIDLSRGAAQKLGFISSGHARVKLAIVR